MRDDFRLPQLLFPGLKFGEGETPWDMSFLLYKGGAAVRLNLVGDQIRQGALGPPQLDRLDLVVKLHEEILAGLAGGGGRESVSSQLSILKQFFGFADRTNRPLTLDGVTDTYCAWSDSLFHRTRLRKGSRTSALPEQRPLSMRSAYGYGATIGRLLDLVLERHTRIVELTRLESPDGRKAAVGVQTEKQNLADTFVFGACIQDICDALTIETTVAAPLPVRIELRSGKVITCIGELRGLAGTIHDHPLAHRSYLANLRVEAELLMFIAQTGMNLAQAQRLRLRHFFYVSHLDGYQVKEHKARRGGAVLFEIFKDYKPHFERYLAWRRELFSHSDSIFPIIKRRGSRPDRRFQAARIRAVCKDLEIRFIGPRSLRATRVNWLLRRSSDPDLTAEMAQHTKETLLKVYERPSLQRAIGETTRFWAQYDPHSGKKEAVAPGGCTGTPSHEECPKTAPKPDCKRPSGCLWCSNHRDLDSLDYVWALESFRHLKVIELSKAPLPKVDDDVPPSALVIDRIRDKLSWFEASTEVRRGWVEEAVARVAEGDIHPAWRDEILELEGRA
ncbi:hypothetical protein R69927_04504 [Paraburkholderia domus]|uniref:Site-specific integrase n=1 Tax=Paraburkholderia domus TaxID=2793075 RepID=A0A9N8N1S6_9BURK|nr:MULTISPECIES: site-specific integrase [Paraburkholderia]CAE6885434.1 hypothetical protein R69927_04504 [Paraburkholderia domus]CAE6934333.1 hypothetical protein R70199_05684 [Paraburkholderia domus]CAE6940447.1 hypothetical protein R70211_05658 [Paraburkholderia domus]CAE6944527.1 hypothetical protein R75471_05548 [Paraburkholderia domus]